MNINKGLNRRHKVNQSIQKILEYIVEHQAAEQKFLPPIRKLEILTECSRQTVFLALKELEEAGVLEAIPRQGYRLCNAELAASMRYSSKEMQIAFILPKWITNDASTSFFSQILKGGEKSLSLGQNCNLVYLTLPWEINETRFDLSRLGLKSRNISGAMLVGPTPSHIAEQFLQRIEIPAILVDNVTNMPWVTCVSQDNLGGASRAIRFLYENGHRRIGMISVNPGKMRLNERLAGFYAEMHNLGLVDNIAFIEEATWDKDTVEGGREIAARLMKKGFNDATAILALNESMAWGAFQEFQAAGMKIPQDMSLMAIGRNSSLESFYSPKLSCVAADPFEIGQIAVKTLLEVMRTTNPIGRSTLLNMIVYPNETVRNLNLE